MQQCKKLKPQFWKKENNIIIYGVPFDEDENTNRVIENFLTVKLNLLNTIYFTKAVRLGPSTLERAAPIKVNLVSECEKGLIYSKGHLFKEIGIRVHDDLTNREKWEKQTKMELRREFLKQGRKVGFRGKHLYVDHKLYC
jgi:hypothetical protein